MILLSMGHTIKRKTSTNEDLSTEENNMDVCSEVVELFCELGILEKVAIVLVILAVIFLVAQFVWYFILILYYKSMD